METHMKRVFTVKEVIAKLMDIPLKEVNEDDGFHIFCDGEIMTFDEHDGDFEIVVEHNIFVDMNKKVM